MAGKAAKSDKDKAQVERFKKKAKELEADESSVAFERAMAKVLRNSKSLENPK
jgi:hypothetical protein